MFLTLKVASISLKALVFPLRAVQTRLKRKERTEKREIVNKDKIIIRRQYFMSISNQQKCVGFYVRFCYLLC